MINSLLIAVALFMGYPTPDHHITVKHYSKQIMIRICETIADRGNTNILSRLKSCEYIGGYHMKYPRHNGKKHSRIWLRDDLSSASERSVLIHELCHAVQYRYNLPFNEAQCDNVQRHVK